MISEDNRMILNMLNIKKGSFICLFFVFIYFGCNQSTDSTGQEYKLTGNALGTTYHITYLGAEIEGLKVGVDSILIAFNYGLSTYDDSSFISQFNNNVRLSKKDLKPGYAHFQVMVNKSKQVHLATDGAFDPSAAQLFKLYDSFKKQHRTIDTFAQQIASKMKGFQEVEFDEEGVLTKNRFRSYNFNAIAKGYFVDILAAFIEGNGSNDYMVEVGGEVHCKGVNSKGTPWNIGVNIPEVGASPSDFFEVISLNNQSMATSGNYQNFYVVDGEVIGHTMDPRTGKPVISDLKSVTIMHNECAIADAYATACMVLGLDTSIALIEKDTSLSAYFIFEENGALTGLHVK